MLWQCGTVLALGLGCKRCPHCQHFAPVYKEIAEQFAGVPVRFTAVNCVEYGSLCRRNGIRGYPSVKVWRIGGEEPGARIHNTKDALVRSEERRVGEECVSTCVSRGET